MTWMMPLLAAMSAPVTLVSFTVIASTLDTANLMVAPLRVSMGPETISELMSAAPRTCLAISTAPHIMSEAMSVDLYADAMAQEVPSLVGRMVTALVFANLVEIDITFSALASLNGSVLPDLVVLFTDLAWHPCRICRHRGHRQRAPERPWLLPRDRRQLWQAFGGGAVGGLDEAGDDI